MPGSADQFKTLRWSRTSVTRPTRPRARRRGPVGRTGVGAPGELGQLAVTFDHMATDLTRAEQTRRQLAADVAHELRTLLAEAITSHSRIVSARDKPTVPDRGYRSSQVISDLSRRRASGPRPR